jgi:hypothetical protein
MLAQKNAVKEYERSQPGKATASRDEPQQQVDAGGMRMINNALLIP